MSGAVNATYGISNGDGSGGLILGREETCRKVEMMGRCRSRWSDYDSFWKIRIETERIFGELKGKRS